MTRFRLGVGRAAAVLTLGALLASACNGKPMPSLPDQGAIDACGLAIGVLMPREDPDRPLGIPDGWKKAADKAAADAKHHGVNQAGKDLQATLTPQIVADGFSEPEIDRYAAAAKAFWTICNESKALDAFRPTKN